LAGEGTPGLYAQGPAAFDGVLYTIGWDEFDKHITGWKTLGQEPGKGDPWIVSEKGIGPPAETGSHAVIKGDLLERYEFSLQVTSPGGGGQAGIYPVFIDQENYLEAVFDYQDRHLLITGRKNGTALDTSRLDLETGVPLYADMKFSDFIEKHFSFDSPAWISGLRFNKAPHGQPDTLVEDIYRKMDIYYRQNGRWHPLSEYRELPSSHPGFEHIGFRPLKADALKLVNREPADHRFYTYKLWADELFRESSHLRVSRLQDKLIFWVNGKEVLRMAGDFPASRVGLLARGSEASFNGITLFSLEAHKAN
ncbi:MAG TPA: hypothetical protein VD772_06320, partial [Anseongella sp.]|nr:hypothetical protein [Anseongella sp.]